MKVIQVLQELHEMFPALNFIMILINLVMTFYLLARIIPFQRRTRIEITKLKALMIEKLANKIDETQAEIKKLADQVEEVVAEESAP